MADQFKHPGAALVLKLTDIVNPFVLQYKMQAPAVKELSGAKAERPDSIPSSTPLHPARVSIHHYKCAGRFALSGKTA